MRGCLSMPQLKQLESKMLWQIATAIRTKPPILTTGIIHPAKIGMRLIVIILKLDVVTQQ